VFTWNSVVRSSRAPRAGGIYGEGGYASDAQRLESLSSVFANGLADAITVGHTSEAQFNNTVANMDRVLARLPIQPTSGRNHRGEAAATLKSRVAFNRRAWR
jgi:hypothetical protein